MASLESKLAEIGESRQHDFDIGRDLGQDDLLVLKLLSALRRAVEQRNEYTRAELICADYGDKTVGELIAENDKEILALLEGKEGG